MAVETPALFAEAVNIRATCPITGMLTPYVEDVMVYPRNPNWTNLMIHGIFDRNTPIGEMYAEQSAAYLTRFQEPVLYLKRR